MRIPKATNIGVAAALALSLTFGAGGVAQAAPAEPDSSEPVGIKSQPTTHQEFYDELKASGLPSEDVKIDGAAATEFDLGEGISITVPKPRSGISAQLSGKMNSKGEPILYFNQSDQKKIKKVGKAAFTALGVVLKGKLITKFLGTTALGSIASFIEDDGICKSGKTLRVTGTVDGALKEIKCV